MSTDIYEKSIRFHYIYDLENDYTDVYSTVSIVWDFIDNLLRKLILKRNKLL